MIFSFDIMIHEIFEAGGFRLCNGRSNIEDVSLVTYNVRDEVLACQKSKDFFLGYMKYLKQEVLDYAMAEPLPVKNLKIFSYESSYII